MGADTWAELLNASGIRRFAGQDGQWYSNKGKIFCENAPRLGVDENLFGILKATVDDLFLVLRISSVDTGGHVKNSRHYFGRAVDIDQIYAVGHDPKDATTANSDAVEFVQYLLKRGFKVGEGRPQPAIIFGPPGYQWNPTKIQHAHHVHVSLPARRK